MDTQSQTKGAGTAPLPGERLRATAAKPAAEVYVLRRLFREDIVRSVLGWLRRLGVPPSDRLDVAQDILLAAFTSLSRYDPGRAAPERWLNRIAVHVAAHYHHRQRGRHRREVLLDASELAIADERPGAEELLGSEQQRRLVRSCMETIAPEHRSLLLARHVDETPMAEIASRLGTPLSTTYKRHACAIAAFLQIARNDATR